MSTFRIDVGQDGVALLLMDVPGESANTLRADFNEEFEQGFKKLSEDPAIKAVVLCHPHTTLPHFAGRVKSLGHQKKYTVYNQKMV